MNPNEINSPEVGAIYMAQQFGAKILPLREDKPAIDSDGNQICCEGLE